MHKQLRHYYIYTYSILIAIWLYGTTGVCAEINVPGDFVTIQEAINAAASNQDNDDTIIIAPSNQAYVESLVISESGLTLQGDETARCWLQSPGSTPIINISGSNGVTIRNLTFINPDNNTVSAIAANNNTNLNISNNVFTLDSNGTAADMQTEDTPDNTSATILNNTFSSNGTAIIRDTAFTTIKNNIFSNNATTLENFASDTSNISFNCFSESADEVGTDNPSSGSPLFVSLANRDFHLRSGSPCIDAGDSADSDIIDSTRADAGAYGGQLADRRPFPVAQPVASEDPAGTGMFNLTLSWDVNPAYRVAGYRVYYDSDQSGPPYNGNDAKDAVAMPLVSPIQINSPTNTSITLNDLEAPNLAIAAPQLLSLEPGNQLLTATWTAIDNATAYIVNYGITSPNENSVSVPADQLSTTIANLQNAASYSVNVVATINTRYYLAVSVLDNASTANESVLSPETSISLGSERQSLASNELSATPEQVVPFPALPDQGSSSQCFIATAAYGHFDKPQVQLLRDFRDQYLLTHTAGTAFVNWYYQHSPAAADYIAKRPVLRSTVGLLLTPAVGLAWFMTKASVLQQILLLALLFLCSLLLRQKYANTAIH